MGFHGMLSTENLKMNRYSLALLSRLIPLILAFTSTGFLLANQRYYVAGVGFIVGCWFAWSATGFLKRTIKDTKRLIEAIRYAELNISFRSFADKGLYPELIPLMEEAVLRFNAKLQETEVESRFYDTLLNRIDSAILVIGRTNEIEWINTVDEHTGGHFAVISWKTCEIKGRKLLEI